MHLDPELLGRVDVLKHRQAAVCRARDDVRVLRARRRPRPRLELAREELVEGPVLGQVGLEQCRRVNVVRLDKVLDVRQGVDGRVERDALLDALLLRSDRASAGASDAMRPTLESYSRERARRPP